MPVQSSDTYFVELLLFEVVYQFSASAILVYHTPKLSTTKVNILRSLLASR
jgi:hypothetical protein